MELGRGIATLELDCADRWVRVTANFLVEAMRSRAAQISGSLLLPYGAPTRICTTSL